MKEFLLVFRREFNQSQVQPSPEQFQVMMKQWQDWSQSLVEKNNYGNSGKRLSFEGRVVKPDKTVTNGPYVEIKEALNGYMFITANDIDEAAELAKGCPILTYGGNVEVRPIMQADGKS